MSGDHSQEGSDGVDWGDGWAMVGEGTRRTGRELQRDSPNNESMNSVNKTTRNRLARRGFGFFFLFSIGTLHVEEQPAHNYNTSNPLFFRRM